MGTLARDLRHGLRQLFQNPAFAAAAIGSLALGIGLNVTIFSVVNAVLLRGQPLQRPDQLVEIYSGLSKDYPQLTTSYPDLQDIERASDALAGLAASSYVRGILSTVTPPRKDRAAGAPTGGKGALVTGETITSNFFRVLGIPIAMGREFRDDENLTPDASPVIIISHGLWQRSLGGSPNVIGTTLRISGVEYTVVGVAPRQYTGTVPGIVADFWVPLMMVEQLSFSGVQTGTDEDPGT